MSEPQAITAGASLSLARRLFVPPKDLVRLLRWVLLMMAPLGLVPWFIALGRRDLLQEWAAATLILGTGVFWARAYLRDRTHWAFELAHGVVIFVALITVPGEGSNTGPGGAAMFLLSMLLQIYAGPVWRFALRTLVVVGALMAATTLLGHPAWYTVFGVTAAHAFSYLLGVALARQQRTLERARALTQATSALAGAGNTEEVLTSTATAALSLAQGAVASRVELSIADEPPLVRTASAAPGPARAASEAKVHDSHGIEATLRVDCAEPPDADLELALTTLLTAAVQAVGRARLQRAEHEVEIAARLQSALVPRRFQVRGFDIAGAMLPASEVGGDYFDVLATDGGCFVGIGDVSGHGLEAGLVMLMAQSVVSALVRQGANTSPRDVVVRLNEVLHENVHRRLGSHEHVTFTLLRIDADGSVVFAGAHEELLVRRAGSGKLERIATPGTWVGASPDVAQVTVESRFTLSPGDVLLLHTDGVVEARNSEREEFGLERLEAAFSQVGELSADAAVDRVMGAVRGFTAQREDDQSLLWVRYLGLEAGVRPAPSGTARAGVA